MAAPLTVQQQQLATRRTHAAASSDSSSMDSPPVCYPPPPALAKGHKETHTQACTDGTRYCDFPSDHLIRKNLRGCSGPKQRVWFARPG